MLSLAEQLALQHQIEYLQAQQQQILNAYQQQAGRIGGSTLPFNPSPMPHLSPQPQQFQFPQPQTVPLGAPTQPSSHRRQASGVSGGPPPAPSSGTSANLTDNSGPQRRPSGGQSPGGQGHVRRHSLALADAKKAAEQAQARRSQVGFQFPTPSSGGPNASSQSPNLVTSNTTVTPAPIVATATASVNEPLSTTTASSGSSLGPRSRMSGHGRSQSLAVSGTATRGGTASTGRIGGFQFPAPAATGETALSQSSQQTTGQSVERRSSGHQRSGSRNFDANWRNTGQNQNAPAEPQVQTQPQQFTPAFQPGHRARESMGAIGSFSFPTQQVLIPSAPAQGIYMNPTTGQAQLLNPGLLAQQQHLTQLQLQQAAQALNVQQMGIGQINVAHGQNQQMSNQQQRKTLFTPYLPQANLPALLADGQLVSGILRVNKKNRNDAYVSTQDGLLDADIFICGSKDRNRALEGDLVAVELLDVDQVWGQKREKEEKKKRKDNPGTTASSSTGGTGADGQEKSGQEGGGVKRKGSLTLRSTQKKNDDVEVEGQSLLLVEEEEINDEQKPLYAGHIVAVIERVAGQMFSGYDSKKKKFSSMLLSC